MLMFVAAMLIFGSVGIFRRTLPVSSAFLALTRGILGSLFLLAFMKLTGKRIRISMPVRTVLWLAASGAVMGFNWILLFEAYRYTTVGVATLCYYMQPTIVMLLSPLLFGEKLTKKKGFCAAAAIAGMVLVSGAADGGAVPEGHVRGVLLGLGAAVLYSCVVIMNKKVSGLDAYQKTVIQLASAGLVMIPYLLLTRETAVQDLNVTAVLLLLAMGLIHTGIAYVLYFGSMDGLKAQSIAIFSYIDPVSALLFSALFLKEPLSASGIIGAAMIIGSALICES